MPDSAGKTIVEVLYPEYANQAGDNGNAMYLRACLPDATFVETSHDDVPYFAEHVPSLVLLCGMSEAQQEKTIELLMPYRDRLNELVDAGVPMLFTGSAPEVLGSKIVNPDGSEVCGLGILDFVTHRNMPERYHDVVIGDFVPAFGQQPIKVVGFKIQFTQVEGPVDVSNDTRYTTIETNPRVGKNLAGGGCSQTRFCHQGRGLPQEQPHGNVAHWPVAPAQSGLHALSAGPHGSGRRVSGLRGGDPYCLRRASQDIPSARHGLGLLARSVKDPPLSVCNPTANASLTRGRVSDDRF